MPIEASQPGGDHGGGAVSGPLPRAEHEQRSGVQVLARAATILRLLAADSSGRLTFSELVARAGLPRTTVHRIRFALEEEGFVYADVDAASATLLRVRDEIQIVLQTV